MSVERIEFLIVVIAAVAILARRLKLPYTVGLLLAGIGLGVLPGNEHLQLTRDLIFSFLGPPLVFEAALKIRWSRLQKELPFVLTLATLGLLLAAVIVALGMYLFAGWPLSRAAVFAVLISATDPVSVIAAFKESGFNGRTRLLIESESMLNDGTATVAFGIALAIAFGAQVEVHEALGQFAWSSLGGVAMGLLVGGLGLAVAGRIREHLVEIVITVATAYGAFLAAEHFQMSGILATLTAGIIAGNYRSAMPFADSGKESVESFWEFAGFAADSIVFLLIGVRAARVLSPVYLAPTAIAIVLVVAGRAVSVYGLSALFMKTRWRLEMDGQHLMVWGGLRGALALALALSLPQTMAGMTSIDEVTLGVVVFSVVIQGLTLRPLIRRVNSSESKAVPLVLEHADRSA